MSDTRKKVLIDTGIGLIVVILVWLLEGLFQASSLADVMRILSDGFFVAGFMFLAMGLLNWTKNGGVMDGLGFSFKTAMARIRSDFETAHMSFAEYREEREKKATSSKPMLLSGLIHLVVASVLFAVYLLIVS